MNTDIFHDGVIAKYMKCKSHKMLIIDISTRDKKISVHIGIPCIKHVSNVDLDTCVNNMYKQLDTELYNALNK